MTHVVIQSEAKNLGNINWMLSGFFWISPQRLVFLLFGRLNGNYGGEDGLFQEKTHFFEIFLLKCLQVRKKAVPLHRF